MPKSKGRRRPSHAETPVVQQRHGPVSPTWYVVLMLSLMGIGLVALVLDYMDVFPGGSKVYVIAGVVLLAAGFFMTLYYKAGEASPLWYVVLMFGLMALGIGLIVLNYIGIVPGGQKPAWLYTGLGCIAGGFLMTMNYQ